jgi:hypothetical protein
LLSFLGPAIVASAVALIGLAGLWWMNKNRPQLQLPVRVSDEEPDLPFEEPLESGLTPEKRLLRAIFGDEVLRRRLRANRESVTYDAPQTRQEHSNS